MGLQFRAALGLLLLAAAYAIGTAIAVVAAGGCP